MTRFFTEDILPESQLTYTFIGDEARYLMDVLRIQTGEQIILCDGARTDFYCEVTAVTKQSVSVQFIKRQANQTEPPYEAVLYQALVKGEKMELIIQKAVELGVSKIVPVICDRCVVKLDNKTEAKKLIRWQKIAQEAARQCGRGKIPKIAEPMNFAQAIKTATVDSQLTFLPWEGESTCSMAGILDEFARDHCGQAGLDQGIWPIISFFIGPEGGFAPSEVELAQSKGIKTVSLGRRILRTETAGLAVLSMFVYRLEKM